MSKLALRTPDDVRRLFSALADELTHETGALSVAEIDHLALSGGLDAGEVDFTSIGLSLLVAVAAGWVAIQGYERNGGDMRWGLTWAGLGYLFPVPAVVYAAAQQR